MPGNGAGTPGGSVVYPQKALGIISRVDSHFKSHRKRVGGPLYEIRFLGHPQTVLVAATEISVILEQKYGEILKIRTMSDIPRDPRDRTPWFKTEKSGEQTKWRLIKKFYCYSEADITALLLNDFKHVNFSSEL